MLPQGRRSRAAAGLPGLFAPVCAAVAKRRSEGERACLSSKSAAGLPEVAAEQKVAICRMAISYEKTKALKSVRFKGFYFAKE